MKALFRAPGKRYVAPNHSHAAVFAEIDAVVFRKENLVAQVGHVAGELRHIGCEWVSAWNRTAVISRSGNKMSSHALTTPNIPDREISLGHSAVMVDNFPNGKLDKP